MQTVKPPLMVRLWHGRQISLVHLNAYLKDPDWREAILERLEERHGTYRLAEEASGEHVYIPCPRCLEDPGHGERELFSRHLAINIDRFMRVGRYAHISEKEADMSASCMRENKKAYSVKKLLNFASLEDRGFDRPAFCPTKKVLSAGFLKSPGPSVIPVINLPAGHPCVEYLRKRGVNVKSAWEQMGASFCEEDIAERKYKKFPGGLEDRYAGRLILQSFVGGEISGWQARLIDRVSPCGKYREMLMPWGFERVAKKIGNDWVTLPQFVRGGMDSTREIARYLTSPGRGVRSRMLIGFDAAVEWARQTHLRGCFLVEGPISAARPGPPFIAVCGKTLTTGQSILLQETFEAAVWVIENDKKPDGSHPGMEAAMSAASLLSGRMKFSMVKTPEGVKDIGDIPREKAISELYPLLIALLKSK